MRSGEIQFLVVQVEMKFIDLNLGDPPGWGDPSPTPPGWHIELVTLAHPNLFLKRGVYESSHRGKGPGRTVAGSRARSREEGFL